MCGSETDAALVAVNQERAGGENTDDSDGDPQSGVGRTECGNDGEANPQRDVGEIHVLDIAELPSRFATAGELVRQVHTGDHHPAEHRQSGEDEAWHGL